MNKSDQCMIVKRPAGKSPEPSCSKRSAISKQGNVTSASVKVPELGKRRNSTQTMGNVETLLLIDGKI